MACLLMKRVNLKLHLIDASRSRKRYRSGKIYLRSQCQEPEFPAEVNSADKNRRENPSLVLREAWLTCSALQYQLQSSSKQVTYGKREGCAILLRCSKGKLVAWKARHRHHRQRLKLRKGKEAMPEDKNHTGPIGYTINSSRRCKAP